MISRSVLVFGCPLLGYTELNKHTHSTNTPLTAHARPPSKNKHEQNIIWLGFRLFHSCQSLETNMGACCGKAELTPEQRKVIEQQKVNSKALAKAMQAENSNDICINKLLLLGAGESGKSTLFKQVGVGGERGSVVVPPSYLLNVVVNVCVFVNGCSCKYICEWFSSSHIYVCVCVYIIYICIYRFIR